MLQFRLRAALAVAAVLGAGHPPFAQSQSYPVKPVRMLVGFAPGGSTDTIARIITPRLSERLGQQVIVENRPGAAGNVAAELAAKAAPDGYTVFMASASHSINASLYPKLSFDAIRDFTAITQVTSSPFILVVHPSIPARNTRELIALAKSRPGTLTYGSGGASSQLAGELFNSMAGVKLVHVPYKSSGPAATDLLGGQIGIMFSAPPAVLSQVAAGKLRALGVTSLRRLSSLPDVPAIAESGLARLRGELVVRPYRSGGNSPGCRRPVECRRRARYGPARYQEPPAKSRPRADHQYAGGIWRLPARRRREVGQGGSGIRRASALIAGVPAEAPSGRGYRLCLCVYSRAQSFG